MVDKLIRQKSIRIFISYKDGKKKKTKKPGSLAQALFLFLKFALYRETFAAATGTGCVGVVKIETFAIKAVGEIQFGAGQV